MIRLLLVDDEENTRQGICSVVPWEALGIDEVVTADDGVNGVEIAKELLPDILLTDVRMPRMDGIKMAFEIRKFIPDCNIIFMSGYSDKEYLKSAITLAAAAYLEKPLDINEMREVLARTVALVENGRREEKHAQEIKRKLNISIPALKNQLAVTLLRKSAARGAVRDSLSIALPSLTYRERFVTVLVALYGDSGDGDNCPKLICEMLEKQLELAGIDGLVGRKDDRTVVAHLCLQRDGKTISLDELRKKCVRWKELLESVCRFVLIVGEPAANVLAISDSYNTAVITLQRAFFYKPYEVLYSNVQAGPCFRFEEETAARFIRLVREEKPQEAADLLKQLTDDIRRHDGTPVSLVKDYYAKLYDRIARPDETRENGRDLIFSASFLTELEDLLLKRLQDRFAAGEESVKNPIVEKIERYVGRHYGDTDLSLASIANELDLTGSYLCVVFKKETGMTLNRYITQYRMDRAKEALRRNGAKIKRVAYEVGYNDCNYFIKAFKKATGVTPLEFRDTAE